MTENRCYGCMRIKSEGAFCDQCGYPESAVNPSYALPAGTMLQGKYLLGKVLGQNQHGILYLALDCNLDATVVVQEYYPAGMTVRSSGNSTNLILVNPDKAESFESNKLRFLREAQQMAKQEAVDWQQRVTDVFQENATAYLVRPYVPNTPLEPKDPKPIEPTNPGKNVKKSASRGGAVKWVILVVMIIILALAAILLIRVKDPLDRGPQYEKPARSTERESDREKPMAMEALVPAATRAPAPEMTTSAPAHVDGHVSIFWYAYNDMYLSQVRAEMESQLQAHSVSYSSYDANFSQSTQFEQIITAVTKGTSVLMVNMVSAYDYEATITILDIAMSADIPVIFFNRNVPEDALDWYDQAVYVGTDYTMAGVVQGEMISEFLLTYYDKVDINGDGMISYVMFKGQEGNMEADARTEKSVETIDERLLEAGRGALVFYNPSNQNRYLVDQFGSWSATQGREHMQTILDSHSVDKGNMVELVIANNDAMALGALDALQSKGYNIPGGTYIPVFGIDGTDEAQNLIREGAMMGSVMQDSQGLVDALIQIASNYMKENYPFQDVGYASKDGQRLYLSYIPYVG